jgi:hypothetical protein
MMIALLSAVARDAEILETTGSDPELEDLADHAARIAVDR